MKKWIFSGITGFCSGVLNGLFGSGGGIIAVPLFVKSGIGQKESHATALFMMLCLSALSAFLYFESGSLSFKEATVFLPGGIAGAIAASIIFKKMYPALLRKIFGGFVTFSAARMLWGIVSEWV